MVAFCKFIGDSNCVENNESLVWYFFVITGFGTREKTVRLNLPIKIKISKTLSDKFSLNFKITLPSFVELQPFSRLRRC